MVCVKEFIAKLLTFVVMTGVGATIFVIYAFLAHYFETVFGVLSFIAVSYLVGWVVTNLVKDIKQRKGGAK